MQPADVKKIVMDNRINILNELKDLDAAILMNTDNKNYFFVPGNFFNDFAETVQTEIFIQFLPVLNPYKTPANYFENFSDTVFENLHAEKSIENLRAIQQPSYTLPEDYFENFADSILKKIKTSVAQELEELSPYLNRISKTNVYTVPENYFKQFEIPSTQKVSSETKVVSFKSKTRKWFNYAAAASIAAVLFGGGYLYFSGKSTNSSQQSSVSKLANTDVQKEISTLSDDEINSYLTNNNSTAVYTSSTDAEQQPKIDVQSLLQNVSDEEIQEYLKQDPESHETGGGI